MRDEPTETDPTNRSLLVGLIAIFLISLLISLFSFLWGDEPDVRGEGTSTDGGEVIEPPIPWSPHPKLRER